jgi:uridylate kinase
MVWFGFDMARNNVPSKLGTKKVASSSGKNVWVISLGGSRIVPDDVDDKFLLEFRKLIDSHGDKKFVVVCGGGRTARRYMGALKKLGKSNKGQSMEGIAVTRLHAEFMARFFGKKANEEIPMDMKRVENLLKKNRVVFCGALRWRDKNTSDGTAAKIAGRLKSPFINLTNVRGLYDRDPSAPKGVPRAQVASAKADKLGKEKAKFISKISWRGFLRVARKVKFEAGQHFVLDKVAAEEILKKQIVTYIVGSLKSMDGVLRNNKKINGTVISG